MPDHLPRRHDRSSRAHRAQRSMATACIAVFLIALPACSQREPASRPPYPCDVHGQVLLDDAPLSFGTIAFIPEMSEDAGGRPGIARIDPNGAYRVGNANPDKPAGLKPGRYRVTVLAMQARLGGDDGPVAQLAVPDEYTDDERTPLHAEVRAGANELNFTLHRRPGRRGGEEAERRPTGVTSATRGTP